MDEIGDEVGRVRQEHDPDRAPDPGHAAHAGGGRAGHHRRGEGRNERQEQVPHEEPELHVVQVQAARHDQHGAARQPDGQQGEPARRKDSLSTRTHDRTSLGVTRATRKEPGTEAAHPWRSQAPGPLVRAARPVLLDFSHFPQFRRVHRHPPDPAGPIRSTSVTSIPRPDVFVPRHIGPSDADERAMLAALGYPSLAALVDATVPANIRLQRALDLPAALSEQEALAALERMLEPNEVWRSFQGLGYSTTHTPAVIRRNVLESPGWYTAYTPYQAEIAQGRLEALL